MRDVKLEGKMENDRRWVHSASHWFSICRTFGRALGKIVTASSPVPGDVEFKKMQTHQYVVFATLRDPSSSLSALLKNHPGIRILQQLDESTALVEMSDETSHVLIGQHPEIVVEPNIRYALQAH